MVGVVVVFGAREDEWVRGRQWLLELSSVKVLKCSFLNYLSWQKKPLGTN